MFSAAYACVARSILAPTKKWAFAHWCASTILTLRHNSFHPQLYAADLENTNQRTVGSGEVCEIVNHQGHQGTRRNYLKPKAFVILRALGGSGFHRAIDNSPALQRRDKIEEPSQPRRDG
jgi:hypothetical protein